MEGLQEWRCTPIVWRGNYGQLKSSSCHCGPGTNNLFDSVWLKCYSVIGQNVSDDCSLLIYSWQVAKDRWQHGECNLFHKISVFSLLIYKKSISSTKHLLVCYCLSEEKCWADKVQKRLSYASPQYILIFTTLHISAVTNLIHVSNNKLL